MVITFTNFLAIKSPLLSVISDQLVKSDADYTSFFFSPKIFKYAHKIFRHPFVINHYPSLENIIKESNKLVFLSFAIPIYRGKYKSGEICNKKDFIKMLNEIKIFDYVKYIHKHPKYLVVLILMKILKNPKGLN